MPRLPSDTEADAAWERVSGMSPQSTAFTIVVPVHNEAHVIRQTLSCILRSILPRSGEVQLIVVCNGTEDRSDVVIRQFLKHKCTLHDEALALKDAGVISVRSAQRGGVTIRLITTNTRGKPNALEIGQELAEKHEHQHVICLDADCYVQRDAIAHMMRTLTSSNDFSLVFGKFHGESNTLCSRSTWYDDLLKRWRNKAPHKRESGKNPGAIMGWKRSFVSSIGGIPPQAGQDFALRVIAEAKGAAVGYAADAHTHGFHPSTLVDVLAANARSIRARRQLRRHARSLSDGKSILRILRMEPIGSLNPLRFMKPPLLQFIKGEINCHQAALRIAMVTVTTFLGAIAYWSNPRNQTWRRLSSTKR